MNPDFTPEFTVSKHDYERQYRSLFGPYFNILGLNHSAQGNGENRAMVARMIALRTHGCGDAGSCFLCSSVPKSFENFDEFLKKQQSTLRRRIRCSVQTYKRWFYNRAVFDDSYCARRKWVTNQHVKRKLRVRAYNASIDMGGDGVDDDTPVGFKGKPGELLGISKKRGIGDLGVNRTNATAFAFESLKKAMEGEYTHGYYTFRFVSSPDIEELRDVFDRMAQVPPGHVYFVFFSDDGIIGVHCADGVMWFNTDLKQCDGSHFTPFLDMVEQFLTTDPHGLDNPYARDIRKAYGYLASDMEVRNKYNRKEKVQYKFTSKRMYSGFAGTTITNNFANLFIGFCLQIRVPHPGLLTKSEFKEAFEFAAADAGYICHLQICEHFEDLQFLKHSPVLSDNAEYIPTMNLGTYMRGFGTFYGDLPARGSYFETSRAFVSDVVESRLGWGNHEFNRAFHHLVVKHGVKFQETAAYGAVFRGKRHGTMRDYIPLSSLCVRYRCTITELTSLVNLISVAQVGDAVEHPLVKKIHDFDYG